MITTKKMHVCGTAPIPNYLLYVCACQNNKLELTHRNLADIVLELWRG